MSETTVFEPKSTNVVASPIPKPFKADEVVASVGHIPKTSTKIGFSFINPFRNILRPEFFCISIIEFDNLTI
jgi:hypothetical protein